MSSRKEQTREYLAVFGIFSRFKRCFFYDGVFMDNKHSNEIETVSSRSGKGAASEAVQRDIVNDEKNRDAVESMVSDKKPGAILALKRVEAGMTQEQIASRLKMTLRQVRDLEADNYEALHGIAISRGFVRAYARVLNLDPEPLVALFEEKNIVLYRTRDKASVQKHAEPFVRNRMPFRKKNNVMGKLLIALIIVVVAAVVAWNMKWFSFGTINNEQGGSTVSNPVVDVRSDGNRATLPVAGGEMPAGVVTANVNAATEKKQSSDAGAEAATVYQMAGRSAQTASTVTNGEKKASLLVIDFQQKSWIQVRKKDGTVLAEYIGKPGERREMEISEPVSVVVGYAPGVKMMFKGEPVDLVRNTNNSVARIMLN